MLDKILGVLVVLFFICLVISIFLTNGNKFELIICGCITVTSFVLFQRNKTS